MSNDQNEHRPSGDDQYPDRLLDHNYDGIQEYDNPMPGWWKWLFVGTVVWAAIYYVGIQFLGVIPTYEEDLEQAQAELQEMRDEHEMKSPTVDSQFLADAASNETVVATGKEAYMANCASCHGQNGEGLIGPNLTDQYWIHGGSLTDIYRILQEGVTDKGMPAWGGVLTQDQIVGTVAYIESIRGTDPANAKEPQGEPYEGQ